MIALNRRRLRPGVRRTHALPTRTRREPVALGIPGSLGRRSRHELRRASTRMVGVGADMDLGDALVGAERELVARLEREAVGQDGEKYAWTWMLVVRCPRRSIRVDVRVRRSTTRMRRSPTPRSGCGRPRAARVANRASQTARQYRSAMRAHDVDGTLECCSDRLVYDDRRRLSGDPIRGRDELRAAFERVFTQYTPFRVTHAGGAR